MSIRVVLVLCHCYATFDICDLMSHLISLNFDETWTILIYWKYKKSHLAELYISYLMIRNGPWAFLDKRHWPRRGEQVSCVVIIKKVCLLSSFCVSSNFNQLKMCDHSSYMWISSLWYMWPRRREQVSYVVVFWNKTGSFVFLQILIS